ncbi:MAG: Rieske 2Fe-2S domain-containing protein [Gammaproteobacteria bacterium]|jgi:nitrite reductase/ring-hydroxylating ferredoxin subunit
MEYIEVAMSELKPGTVVPVQVLYNTRDITALVLKHNEEVAVYLDLCPHNKIVLSQTGNYLNVDGSRLMCEAHGATFNLQDGSCDNGPCQGDTLAKIPFETVNEAVRIRKQLAPQ